ncbi:MAG: hypothetical protein HKP61_14725 [Dactylosporangium sp.]|nr:hypothetical protein [Dactylosporangium sp.]NNJ62165.1 hypothetical protein [Dactylosporangium sp.]
MQAMRTLDFLDGTTFTVSRDTCRGCFMNDHDHELPPILVPVLDDGIITVRQDAEWAVPGFMIVGIRPHLGSIGQMPLDLAHRLTTVMHVLRQAMDEFPDICAVQTYQEEKLDRPHYHTWMLPLWKSTMDRHTINPRIYESSIARYLELFEFPHHREAIHDCAARIQDFLRGSDLLRRQGFLPRTPPVASRPGSHHLGGEPIPCV